MARYRKSAYHVMIAALMATMIATLIAVGLPAHAGDSTFGTITAVKSANVVTFKHDAGTYDVLVAGVEAPAKRADAENSRRFIVQMAVGQRAQFRFDGRNAQGLMVGKLYLDDSSGRVRDLGVEMIRAGMATPARGYQGYKYGELQTAMVEARARKIGIWKTSPQR